MSSRLSAVDLLARADVAYVFRRGAGAGQRGVFADPLRNGAAALEAMQAWPGYAASRLAELPGLAADLDLASIQVKDESQRFGLCSFKPMGAAHALLHETSRALGLNGALRFADVRDAIIRRGAPFTVACASDGNHGRALAWAAALLALPCVVFLHERVSAARESAIRALGARTERVAGNYDDSVRAADSAARAHGWQVISDAAYGDYERIPEQVMAGYMGLAAEIADGLGDRTPTHIVAQAGVGGFAAALLTYFAARFASERIVSIVVEPQAAACLLASARTGARTIVSGTLDTIMAGLACGEPSTTAWRAIAQLDVHFLSLPDIAAAHAMRVFARSRCGDTPIVAGESGAAGLAALLVACEQPALRAALDLTTRSRVLLVNTEGATDPDAYATLTQTGQ